MTNTSILFRRRLTGAYVTPSLDLRIVALAALTITFTQRGTGTAEYSTDRNTWNQFVSGQPTATFPVGSTIYLRGNLSPVVGSTAQTSGIGTFSASAAFNVAGCPLSLLGSNYSLTDNVPQYSFCALFYGATTLQHVSGVQIPSGAIGSHALWGMFQECSYLIDAPELPSTNVAEYGYSTMFYNCTNLTSAPQILPATSIYQHGYEYMFYGCSSLITAPAISATSLTGERCMFAMFMSCSNLQNAPELYPTSVTNYQYHRLFDGCGQVAELRVHLTSWTQDGSYYWVRGVSANGTFYCPAALPQEFGVDRIPTSWSVQTF